MRLFLILFLMLPFCLSLHAQNNTTFHRAKISLIDKDIHQLTQLGVETDHGHYARGRFLENDFSEQEIDLIRQNGFDVEIVIEDVIQHYQNPNRPSELVNHHERNGHCNENVSCQIGDYPVPQYYGGGSMGGYKTYSQLIQAIDSMSMLYPDLITPRINISEDTTYGGNHVFYVRISDHPLEDELEEPQVLYTALHHAREPNSMSQMLYFMWYLLENFDTDPEIKNIVENTALYFVPCVNPDGYIINETNFPLGGGLWRKNARKDENGQIFGVDLNRNYGHFWGFDNNGSSPNLNSETYRGDTAFSEPETKFIKQLCEEKEFSIALNYHTHGNLLIYPWGYNDTPTDEDVVFRGLSHEMTHENCFTSGTGTETVGYVVNGDSDDWMYGETTTKNKIYSMTPEVGPSFWPPKDDIVSLDQSCMAMNLKAAQLVSNLYEIRNETVGPLLQANSTIDIAFQKTGLGEGEITVIIEGTTSNIIANRFETTVDVATGDIEVITFPFDYDPSIVDGEQIEIKVNIVGKGYSKEEFYQYEYYENDPEIILNDATEEETLWESTGDWALTDQYVTNESFSLTDSPSGEYRRNASTRTILKTPINLSEAIYAELTFDARWEIETDYDYAMVMASTDGVNFTPLCGNYTNTGNEDQIIGEPLYDGFQTSWVQENISLIEYVGQPEVYIQFLMASDQFVEEDGIYFDNINVVQIIETPSSTSDKLNSSFSVYPNPAFDQLNIKNSTDSDFISTIYSTTGEALINGKSVNHLAIGHLPSGIYIIEVKNEMGAMVQRFVKY